MVWFKLSISNNWNELLAFVRSYKWYVKMNGVSIFFIKPFIWTNVWFCYAKCSFYKIVFLNCICLEIICEIRQNWREYPIDRKRELRSIQSVKIIFVVVLSVCLCSSFRCKFVLYAKRCAIPHAIEMKRTNTYIRYIHVRNR